MVGALFIWMADWRGRRQHIFMGCFGVCVATVITSTAKTLPVFIGGRFLLSFFATCAHTAAPLFLVEMSPPQYRGTVAGLYNTLYYMVSIIAFFVANLLTTHSRALFLPLRLCMVLISTSQEQETLIGACHYGYR
jgi:MFS family permease